MTEQAVQTREARAEETTERRRKRSNEVGSDPVARRYNLPADFFEHNKYVYYQAVDEGDRLRQLTEDDDYDFVTGKGAKAAKKDVDGVLKYRSGTAVDGGPQYTYLLRKLKKFADEDRAERIRKVDEAEKARLTKTPNDAPDQSYTPKR